MTHEKDSHLRIAIVRTGGLGDVLLLVPALRALRRAHPEARIHLVAPGPVGRLLEACGEVDGATAGDDPRLAGIYAPGYGAADLSEALGCPDRVVALSRNTVGVSRALRQARLPAICADPFPPAGKHAARHAVEIVGQAESANAEWRGPASVGPLALPSRPIDAPPPVPHRNLAVIHPGAGANWKRAPVGLFKELAERLRCLGFEVVFVSGPAEDGIQVDLSEDRGVVSGIALSELASLLLNARVYVGNDSGPTHLAGLLGVPTIALFGPTHPACWGPLGPHVTVVRSCRSGPTEKVRVCHDVDCMNSIAVDDVLSACMRQLDLAAERAGAA